MRKTCSSGSLPLDAQVCKWGHTLMAITEHEAAPTAAPEGSPPERGQTPRRHGSGGNPGRGRPLAARWGGAAAVPLHSAEKGFGSSSHLLGAGSPSAARIARRRGSSERILSPWPREQASGCSAWTKCLLVLENASCPTRSAVVSWNLGYSCSLYGFV